MAETDSGGQQQQAQAEPDLEKLRADLAAAQNKNSEYERLLLDPAYLDFLAGPRSATAPAQQQQQQVDFDSMTNKELVEYMYRTMQGEINRNVVPLSQNQQLVETKNQVVAAAAKYQDFWDYKGDMVSLARANPALSAEDAYLLAKAKSSQRPRNPAKRTEAPTGGGSVARNQPKGFEAKFLEAWSQSGISKARE